MRNKVIKFASTNLALLLLFALNPYPRWFLPNGVVQIVFFFTTVLSILQGRYYLERNRLPLVAAILVYLVYFTLPIWHVFKSGYMLYYIVFIAILFYDEDVYYEAYKKLKKIFVVVCAFSLLIWLLHLLHIPIPFYHYRPTFRHSAANYYEIYGLCVRLVFGSADDFGMDRICGLFAEPGHFGIYLSLIMAVERFEFKTKENILMLVTGILTFSTAFYGMLTMGIVYRLLSRQSNLGDIYKFAILIVSLIPILVLSPKIMDAAVGRVANYGADDEGHVTIVSVVENRASDSFKRRFDNFVSVGNIIIGHQEQIQDTEMLVTNWRGLVYRYGIAGVIIIFILLLCITKGLPLTYRMLLLCMAILVLAHRCYIMYTPGVYMMLALASMCYFRIDKIREEEAKVVEESKINN